MLDEDIPKAKLPETGFLMANLPFHIQKASSGGFPTKSMIFQQALASKVTIITIQTNSLHHQMQRTGYMF